jgi:hypothetical protein
MEDIVMAEGMEEEVHVPFEGLWRLLPSRK